MLRNIHSYQNMQYQVSPTDQTQENGQKPLFWLLGPFKRPFGGFWMIQRDQILSKCWQNVSSQSVALNSRKWRNPCFGYLNLSKRRILWFLNDPACLIPWPTHLHHLVQSKYAMPRRTNGPNSRKWPKTSFLARFCRIYAYCAYIFDCAWPITTARCWEIFKTVIIRNTESVKITKVKKMTRNLFLSFLHNLCTLCIPN